jgi:hypothetical protein
MFSWIESPTIQSQSQGGEVTAFQKNANKKQANYQSVSTRRKRVLSGDPARNCGDPNFEKRNAQIAIFETAPGLKPLHRPFMVLLVLSHAKTLLARYTVDIDKYSPT